MFGDAAMRSELAICRVFFSPFGKCVCYWYIGLLAVPQLPSELFFFCCYTFVPISSFQSSGCSCFPPTASFNASGLVKANASR